tara:strand:- start:4745 stop:5149 length:405 start_codon:yes stop_codon:yes gene_type:complete
MLLFLIRVVGLYILNMVTIRGSFPSYDSEQLIDDLRPIISLSEDDISLTYYLISFSVALYTLTLLRIFKPFIEIYLLHYLEISFYFLISLLSISTVYIVLRVYGYSRLYLLLYLVGSSLFLLYSKKISRKYFNN